MAQLLGLSLQVPIGMRWWCDWLCDFVGFGFAGEMFVRTCEEGFDRISMRWLSFCSDGDFAWIKSDL